MKLSPASRERLIVKAHNAGYRVPTYGGQTTAQHELWGATEDRRLVYSTEPRVEELDTLDVEEDLRDSESTEQFELAFERERSLSHIED